MREKKAIQYKQDVVNEVARIKLEFEDFADGIRCIFLIHRKAEGGLSNGTKAQKRVSRNSKEFFEIIAELVDIKINSDIPYRIYSCVNDRNIEKAIRQFKMEQLEADYYHAEQKHEFYFDIRNRWIGCLMQPPQKNSSLFMFDVDVEDNGDALKVLKDAEILKAYRTKKGWHIITKPFNHTKIKLPPATELKTDGLLLLSF